MAFNLDQTWEVAPWTQGVRPGAPPANPWRDLQVRRGGATLLSALVHLVLIWLLLTRLAGDGGEGGGEGTGSGQGDMMLFGLSDPASASASASEAVEAQLVQPPAPVAAATSEVDTSVATELPPIEWTVSRLPPAPRPERQAPAVTGDAAVGKASGSASAGTASGTGGAGAGSGQGSRPVYDPFATAAPLRQEPENAAASRSPQGGTPAPVGGAQASLGGLSLDSAALDSIRMAVARSLPGKRGTVVLVLRVSPTGIVLSARPSAGSAPTELKNALSRALIGKRLYRGSAASTQLINLPALNLG